MQISLNFLFKWEHPQTFHYFSPQRLHVNPRRSAVPITLILRKDITHLQFGGFFNQRVDNLPQSLTHLTFGELFDVPVDHLPENLTHLTFGYSFNQPVNKLPQRLTHLIFGYDFNQPIAQLPPHLLHLQFGFHFDHPLTNLPSSLQTLIFGDGFNHPLHLPPSLKHLTCGEGFDCPLEVLPSSLITLTLGGMYCHTIPNFPPTLQKIQSPFSKRTRSSSATFEAMGIHDSLLSGTKEYGNTPPLFIVIFILSTGFYYPNKIQTKAIVPIIMGRDVIIMVVIIIA